MRTCLISIFAPVVLLVACTPDDAPPEIAASRAEATEFGIEFQKYTLDNGLDIVLHVDRSDPVVAVSTVFHVGSSREVPGRTGFAHFFEHMSFNDSENVPRGANRKYIPELGGTRNGGTSFDYTIYFEAVPKDALEKIFWIDSDRMGYMINTVTEAALEREKQVVKNEKRQRVDNVPYGHTDDVILANLFPAGHPYSWSVIGSLEDLQNATLVDVQEFYQRWYGANNATLAVAGDFDPAVVRQQIEQWFGEIRRGREVEAPAPRPAVLEESRNLWYPDNFAQLPELTRVYPTVEEYHDDTYALDVLATYLSNSKRSPLYLEVVHKQQLAPGVDVDSTTLELAGLFSITIRAMEGVKLDEVAAALQVALQQFAQEGIPANELRRIKALQETDYFESLSSVLGKANMLANLNEFAGDPGYASEHLKRMQAVTADDVMRVFEQYVQGKHYVQTSFVPKHARQLAVSGARLADVVEEKVVQGAEVAVSQGDVARYERTPSKYDR
jgi:zinc protease